MRMQHANLAVRLRHQHIELLHGIPFICLRYTFWRYVCLLRYYYVQHFLCSRVDVDLNQLSWLQLQQCNDVQSFSTGNGAPGVAMRSGNFTGRLVDTGPQQTSQSSFCHFGLTRRTVKEKSSSTNPKIQHHWTGPRPSPTGHCFNLSFPTTPWQTAAAPGTEIRWHLWTLWALGWWTTWNCQGNHGGDLRTIINPAWSSSSKKPEVNKLLQLLIINKEVNLGISQAIGTGNPTLETAGAVSLQPTRSNCPNCVTISAGFKMKNSPWSDFSHANCCTAFDFTKYSSHQIIVYPTEEIAGVYNLSQASLRISFTSGHYLNRISTK